MWDPYVHNPREDVAMGHNLWLHFGVNEHAFATDFDVHQGYRVVTPRRRKSCLIRIPAACSGSRVLFVVLNALTPEAAVAKAIEGALKQRGHFLFSLGPPVVPFYPFLGRPTKIDYIILTSVLERVVV